MCRGAIQLLIVVVLLGTTRKQLFTLRQQVYIIPQLSSLLCNSFLQAFDLNTSEIFLMEIYTLHINVYTWVHCISPDTHTLFNDVDVCNPSLVLIATLQISF